MADQVRPLTRPRTPPTLRQRTFLPEPVINLSNNPTGALNGTNVNITDTTSGDHWDVATPGTGGTLQWDAGSILVATGVTSTTSYVAWTTQLGTVRALWFRAYVTIPAAPPTVTQVVARGMGASVQKFRLTVESTGKLILRDQANTQAATSVSNIPAAQIRVEGFVAAGTVGSFEIRYWTTPGSPGTPTETLTGTGDFAASDFDEFRFGVGASFASVAGYHLGGFNVNTVTWPGPLPPALPPQVNTHRRTNPTTRMYRHAVQPILSTPAAPASPTFVPQSGRPRSRTVPAHRRPSTPIPPDQPGVPAAGRSRIKQPRLLRGHSATPPPAQAALPPAVYPPQGQRSRLKFWRGWRARSTQPVPAQVVVPPAYVLQSWRSKVRPLRLTHPRPEQFIGTQDAPPTVTHPRMRVPRWWRSRAAQSVLAQVVPTPAYPPQSWRARIRFARLPRVRSTQVVPGQVATPPNWPPQAWRARLRALRIGRVRPAHQVGTQAIPPQAIRSRVRLYWSIRPHTATSGPVPAQVAPTPPVYPPSTSRSRIRGIRPVRTRSTSVVADQVVPAPQARVRSKVVRISRARGATVVPPQVAPTSPAFVPRGVRARLIGVKDVRARRAQVVPPQAAPATPTYVPSWRGRLTLRMVIRRVRVASVPPGQILAPVRPRRSVAKRPPTIRRARTGVTPVAQASAPALPRRPRPMAPRRPATARGVTPPQVVPLVAPTFVGQCPRARRVLAGIRRHRGGADVWITTAPDDCRVTRPNTGTVGRPGSGTVGRPNTGTVVRTTTGYVIRPDTGTVERPGCD